MKTIQTISIYFALIASAISQQYSGSNSDALGVLYLSGTYGQVALNNIPITTVTDLSLTPSSIQYNYYSFGSPTSPTLTMSASLPVANTFLQYRTITTRLTLHPFEESLSNFGPVQIQYSGSGNVYSLSRGPIGFASISIPGDYEISGPNQTITGTFDLQMPPSGSSSLPHLQLDVTGYPGSVEMSGNPLFGMGTVNVFSGVVDGVSLSIGGDFFSFSSSTPDMLQQVPEPASTVLLLWDCRLRGCWLGIREFNWLNGSSHERALLSIRRGS